MDTREDVIEAVLSAATENSELLNKLAATSEAPSSYRSHLVHVQRLRDTLAEQDKSVQELKDTVEAQFKVHKKFRDSHLRRFYFRATRMLARFEAKAMKEEREYFTVLSRQSKAEERQHELQLDLNRATEEEKPLEAAAKAHGSTHKRIDELYESLFAGPTPGFDREDERETSHSVAQRNNTSTREGIVNARRASRLLQQALRNLTTAKNVMRFARQEADATIFFFDDALSILSQANSHVGYARSAVVQAGEVLKPLSQEQAAACRTIIEILRRAEMQAHAGYSQAEIGAAVAAAHSKIEEAKVAIDSFAAHVKAVELSMLEEIKRTARRLEDSRQSLQEVRQGIFEEIAGFGEAAPAYMECCDRADGFCNVPEESHDEEHDHHTGHPPPQTLPDVEPPVYDDALAQSSTPISSTQPAQSQTAATDRQLVAAAV